jgi:AcrR family transcriptional regulator
MRTMAPASTQEGRDRVLRHAQALFVERGFDSVSMQQIADSAGLTKAALYYHFRDKEDLFGHVVRREMDRVRLALGTVIREDGTLCQHLQRIALASFAWFQSDIGRVLGDLKTHVSEHRRLAIGCDIQPPYDIIRPCFERAAAAGEIRADLDLDFVIPLFFGMLFSQMNRARLDGLTPPTNEAAAAIVDILLDGIGTGPRPACTGAPSTA